MMIYDDPNREGLENLANAIVLSAVKDFRKAYKKHLKDPENKAAADDVADQIRFFDSEFFTLLTSVDGKTLVRKLKREVEEKIVVAEKKKKKSI